MNDFANRYNLFSKREIDDVDEKAMVDYLSQEFREEEENMLLNGGLFSFYPNDIPKLKSIVFPRMDLVLTTRCSLKCKKCANLMQYYSSPDDVKLDVIKQSINNLLESIDYIGQIYVLGGEPFIYRELPDVIGFLSEKKQIGIIKIVTNGTILRENDYEWERLRVPNAIVTISDYGYKSRCIYGLLVKLRKERINHYRIRTQFFLDTGGLQKRNRSSEELLKVFYDCGTLCKSLYNGKLYICPRAAHGIDLGFIPNIETEYVNLINEAYNYHDEIQRLLSRRKFISCDYCDIRTPGYYDRKCLPAEQVGE